MRRLTPSQSQKHENLHNRRLLRRRPLRRPLGQLPLL